MSKSERLRSDDFFGTFRNGRVERCDENYEVMSFLVYRKGVVTRVGMSIRNRYRYSLLFRQLMQNFSTFFFHYRLGFFPTFLSGKSIFIDRYLFFLKKFFQKFFYVIFSTLTVFVVFPAAGKCFYIRTRAVSLRKIPYALSFFIPFQNITLENVCVTFGHLWDRFVEGRLEPGSPMQL